MISEVIKSSTKPEVKVHMGQCLDIAMAVFRVSGSQLAKDLGVRQQNIWKWRNTAKWEDERIDIISGYFGITRHRFLLLSQSALSEALRSDREELVQHLSEAYPRDKDKVARIDRHFGKVVDLVKGLEG
jgi:hypothetical protein